MDESTTDAPVQEQAAIQPQPEEQHAEAEQSPTSEPTNTNDDDQTDEPEQSDNSRDDFDYEGWLEKKGIDPTTPEGKAAIAKSWREIEKKMHTTTQQSSELEKQLQGTASEQVSNDPVAQQAYDEAKSVRLELQVERWKSQNNVTPEQDAAIGQYLAQNETKAYMLKNGYLTLDDIAAMSGALKQNTEAIKSQSKREVLENLRDKQRTTSPTGAATSTGRSATSGDSIAELEERLSNVTF